MVNGLDRASLKEQLRQAMLNNELLKNWWNKKCLVILQYKKKYNMERYTQVKDGLLNSNHPIYKILSSNNAPVWWSNIKKDSSLYIEIRKQNYLDVYYRGGCAARIKYTRGNEFEIVSHPKYLGRFDKLNPSWYKRRIKDGNVVYEAIYQDSTAWLSSLEKLDQLKDNVASVYSGGNEGESTSEKYIQGELIIKYRNKYLDSEFAYRMFDGQRHTIRIDLIKIENGKFVFEELKRIKDGRLLTKDGEPKILTQMGNYEGFLKQNQEALTQYYRILYKTKKQLGLPVPPINNIDSVCVESKPTLLIFNNYETDGVRRNNRISSMEDILKKTNVSYKLISQI